MAVIGNFPIGGGGGEFLKIWGEKNGRTGYNECSGALGGYEGSTVAMSDGTVFCSSRSDTDQGIWLLNGIEREYLTKVGCDYRSMTEVPGGCLLGSNTSKCESPLYYYDKVSHSVTNITSNAPGRSYSIALSYYLNDCVFLQLYVDGLSTYADRRRFAKFDYNTHKLQLMDFLSESHHTNYLGDTPTGILLGYKSSTSTSEIFHLHGTKGLAKYAVSSIKEWRVVGNVGSRILITTCSNKGGVWLDYANNNFSARAHSYDEGNIYNTLADTNDYIWASSNKGVCKISKSSGALTTVVTAPVGNSDSVPKLIAHEVEGGWLICPANYGDTVMCYLDRNAQEITTLLTSLDGSSSESDIFDLGNKRYLIKQRSSGAAYYFDKNTMRARAIAGTDNLMQFVPTGNSEFVTIDGGSNEIVWYDANLEAITHSGGKFLATNIDLAISAANPRYVIFINEKGITVADNELHTSSFLFMFPSVYSRDLLRVYRRKDWLLIRYQDYNSSGPNNEYAYVFDTRTLRLHQVFSDDYAIPYGERECETLL